MAEPSTVKSVPMVVISEATTITIPEVPVTILTLMEPATGLVSAQSEMASASMDTVRTIIERGPGVINRAGSSHGHHRRIGSSDGTTIIHFHEVLQ